jgi:hypothetical protein
MSGGKGGSAVTGYRYHFGIHAGIGRGEMDELVEIRVGTRLAAQPRMTASGVGTINSPNLFGGDKKEGGIKGDFNLMMGEPTQTMPPALATMISPAPATGFRRMVTLFYEGLVTSLNPYPKPWSFRMRRAVKGWDGAPLRPDLAVIPLLGPDTAVAAGDAYGSEIDGTVTMAGPGTTVGVTALMVPQPGRRITDVLSAYYSLGSEAGTVDVPLLSFDLNPDGTALAYVSPQHYGRTLSFSTMDELMAGGGLRRGWAMGVANGVPNPVDARVVPQAGHVITSVNSLTKLVTPGGGEGNEPVYSTIPILSTTLQSDGSAIVSIPPGYWGNPGYTARYTHAGGQNDVPLTEFIPGPPISFDVQTPAGGLLTSITKVQLVINPAYNQGAGEGGEWFPAEVVDIGFTASGNTVTTTDPRVNGSNLNIIFKYRPSLNSDAVFTPIREIMAMNPAHIIYEALTNREWGRGLDRSLLDTPSFENCATTLKAEEFGMCIRWARRDSIDAFIQEILDTIGATLFMDRSTALMTLRLIRKDYVVSSLKLWDVNNGILTISSSNVNTSSVIINEVIVKYREVVFNEERAVNVQNLASLQSGSFKTMTKTYRGIPTADLARRVAQRDLRANAEGLRRFTLTMDRRGSDITPGHVMRIQDVSRNIPPTVVRVATVKSDGPGTGNITLAVVQDVFAFPDRSFIAEQPNAWSPPNFVPCIGRHQVFEAPYFLLARTMTAADFAFVDNGSAYLVTVAEQAKLSNTGYDIAVRTNAPTPDDIPTSGEAMYCGYTP